jgi:small subunit ribosomal protein S20
MPNLKHAKKAHRQSLAKKARNLKKKVAFRSVIKEIKKLLDEGKLKEAEQLLPKAYKALDKAAKTGVIKKNTAARKKSRLVKKIRKTS